MLNIGKTQNQPQSHNKKKNYQELVFNALDILNTPGDTSGAIRNILFLIKDFTELEAVGIRLQDKEDFPYYEVSGFSDQFIEKENSLCARDINGNVLKNVRGEVILECMCGNVIQGRTDARLPFFTHYGSFVSNATSKLLATTTEKERQSRTRNRCNSEGYESVALIPLRSGVGTIGLLQLNDRQEGMFNLQEINFFERLGAIIGAALARIHTEEKLQESLTQVQALNHELESFAYAVSHDLRAPLRAIEGFSQAILEDYIKELDDQGKDYLLRVTNETQRMAQLIDDLLRLSRITQVELQTTQVSLSVLANRILNRLHDIEPDRNIETFVAAGISSQADPRLLDQVLENLLSNAWKFTSKQPFARIEFASMDRNAECIFYVKDNGVGFDMRYAHKLFAPFQRLHKQADFPGSGIGLSTVRRIVSKHGGRIWCESAVNQGTTFYFTLAPQGAKQT